MKLSVIGSGGWGTALALLLLENGHEVALWSYTEEESRVLRETGEKQDRILKDFLAFAKLSDEGNRYEWNELGFDPIRTSLWTDTSITENTENKFLSYFTTNPFDILVKNGSEGLTAPNISGSYSATYNVLVSTTYANAFELAVDQDAMELLETEQSTVVYDE